MAKDSHRGLAKEDFVGQPEVRQQPVDLGIVCEKVMVEVFKACASYVKSVKQTSEFGGAFEHSYFDAVLDEQISAGETSDASTQDSNGFGIHELN